MDVCRLALPALDPRSAEGVVEPADVKATIAKLKIK
jgi:hypothetical protein